MVNQKKFKENCKWLEENDWKIYKVKSYETCDMMWIKQFPKVKPDCYANNNGIQIVLRCWNMGLRNFNVNTINIRIGFELELRAEPDDKIWISFSCYNLSNDNLIIELDNQIKKLIRAWIACQSSE